MFGEEAGPDLTEIKKRPERRDIVGQVFRTGGKP